MRICPGGENEVLKVVAKIQVEFISKWNSNRFVCLHITVKMLVLHYLRNTRIVLERLVISKFIIYPQTNQDRDGHANSKSTNINERRRSVFLKTTPCNFQIIFYHNSRLGLQERL